MSMVNQIFCIGLKQYLLVIKRIMQLYIRDSPSPILHYSAFKRCVCQVFLNEKIRIVGKQTFLHVGPICLFHLETEKKI